MWTPTTRAQHSRAGLRYGSDLTDAEWAILAPFLPAKARCGRRRAYPMRELVNAMCYVLRGGIAWRLMPIRSRLGAPSTAGLPGYATMAPGRRSTIT
jgi:putative transposase